jgi:hypothetical protein
MFTYDWMRRFGPTRPAYALMEPTMWQVFPGVAHMAVWVGCVQASSQMAVQALRRDAALLIYPGGVQGCVSVPPFDGTKFVFSATKALSNWPSWKKPPSCR